MSAFDDWNGLQLFLAIASSGSLTQAARQLGVNHSTVFRRLNSLESAVGGRLFERHAHGYALTLMGESLLPIANKISAGFDQLERHVIGQDIQPSGVVKLTAPNNIAYRYLPQLISTFSEQYPEIQIELLASNQALNMDTRQADIALRATPNPPEHLVGRKLGEIAWGVYGSARYFSQHGRPENVEQLADHSLLGGAGMLYSLPGFIRLEKDFAKCIQTRCDDLVAMSFLVEAGHGLAILPDDQMRDGIERLFTFTPAGTSNFWILTHPDLRNVTRIKYLMQFLTEALKNTFMVASS